MRMTLRSLLMAAAVAGLAACVPLAPPNAVFVSARFGPPAPRYEEVGYAPGPDYVWIRGYWDWQGVDWVWVPGRWDQRPYLGAVWVPDQWHHASNGWYREQGHWRGNGHAYGRRDRGDRDDDH